MLTLLLLMLLTTYFRFGGWRYTLFVLTNQNHCSCRKNLLCSLKTTKAEIQLLGRKILAAFRGMHVLPAKHSCVYLPRKCGYRTGRWTDRQLRRQNNKSLRKHNNILHNLSYIMYIFWGFFFNLPTCYLPFFSQLGERKRTIRATDNL